MVGMVSKGRLLPHLLEALVLADRQVQVIFLVVAVLLVVERVELVVAVQLGLQALQILEAVAAETLLEVEASQAAPALLSSSTP